MQTKVKIVSIIVVFLAVALPASADEPVSGQIILTAPEEAAPVEVTKIESPKLQIDKKVAATVNDHDILESELEPLLNDFVDQRLRGANVSPEQMAQMRTIYRKQIIELLIDNYLLKKAAAAEGISVTEAEAGEQIDKMIADTLKANSFTREQFDQQLQSQFGMSLEQMKAKTMSDPMFQTRLLQDKLIEAKFQDDIKVTNEQIEQFYQSNLKTRYDTAEQVRASHILFSTMDESRKPKPDDQKQLAKQKAAETLAEVRKEGSDFAALAKQHSSCSSSANGGDLGFFPRTGKMVEPFAAAAFGLEVGQVSDIVETQFGYHIIKVTDKKPGRVVPLAEVRDSIEVELQSSAKRKFVGEYVGQLRSSAKVEYPADAKEPAVAPAKPIEVEIKAES